MPVQPGEMRPSRVTQVISVSTSPAPPSARAPEMHEVKFVRRAVAGAIHVHRRNDDAVAQFDLAKFEGYEHRRNAAPAEPAFDLADVGVIAQTKIFMADALTAGQQTVRELLDGSVA